MIQLLGKPKQPTLSPEDVARSMGALEAPRCRCEHPQTYRDEEGDRRCLCGRRARDEV